MTVRRAFALLGSGEFEPWAEVADRWLVERSRRGPVLVCATASAPEGDEVFESWTDRGLEHYGRLGIEADALPLKTRGDAERDDLVERLTAGGAVFFSGGNPAYLAETLAGSTFWRALVAAVDRGLGYGGCSAGVACLGEATLDSRRFRPGAPAFVREAWRPGLRLFPGLRVGPHWDVLDRHLPGAAALIAGSVPAGQRLLTIDEETAVLGDGHEWSVVGAGGASILEDGVWRAAPSGGSFSADLLG